jgi:hypothetical protein
LIDVEQFKKRGKALWESQQRMAAARYWKSGKRKGTVRVPAQTIYFDRTDLLRWLWKTVALSAIPCPYCSTPIDILNLVPDHIHPRAAGGEFRIENMQCICKRCNQEKGEFTDAAFRSILGHSLTLSPYDQAVLDKRLLAAHHGSAARFHRPKAAKKDPAVFELPPFN